MRMIKRMKRYYLSELKHVYREEVCVPETNDCMTPGVEEGTRTTAANRSMN